MSAFRSCWIKWCEEGDFSQSVQVAALVSPLMKSVVASGSPQERFRQQVGGHGRSSASCRAWPRRDKSSCVAAVCVGKRLVS